MEYREFRDDPHLPEDSGEYAEDLQDIIDRIPIGWGKWISCDKGWYKILAETNRKMKFMYPHYEIHQVKEKYGTLRFYWGTGPGEETTWEDTITEDADRRIVFDIMNDIVHQAEQLSEHICESCGKLGTTRVRNHWYKTLCKLCAVEQDYPLEEWEERDCSSTNG